MEAVLKQLHTKKERLQEAYLAGVLELADFAKAKQLLEGSIRQAQGDLDAQRARMGSETLVPALRASIAAALETLRSPETTIEEKNLAARSILENCVFDKGASTLAVTYRIIF